MKKVIYTLFFAYLSLFTNTAQANNLKIENVSYNASTKELSFDVSWENAWNINTDFRDAVWVFAKYKSSNSERWLPVRFTGPSGQNFGNLRAFHNGEGINIFKVDFSPSQVNIPTTRISFEISFTGLGAAPVNPSFKVFGLEMVFIPSGDFYVGDGSDYEHSFFRQPGASPTSSIEPVLIGANPTEVGYRIGGRPDGAITHDNQYPNGYNSFYMMKYEATQQQMVDFLNCLTRPQQEGLIPALLETPKFKYPMAAQNTARWRHGIAYDTSNAGTGKPIEFFLDLNENNVPNETDDGAAIACNFVTVWQYLAYLDWAHLRPLSVYEYEKAARGFEEPIPYAAAWGNTGFTKVDKNSIINAGTLNEGTSMTGEGLVNIGGTGSNANPGPMRVGFAATPSSNRPQSGGSYFGVMNLSDNLREFYHFSTEAFGTLRRDVAGDGQLAMDGQSDQVFFRVNAIYLDRGNAFEARDIFTTRERLSVSFRNLLSAELDAVGNPVPNSVGQNSPDFPKVSAGIRGGRR